MNLRSLVLAVALIWTDTSDNEDGFIVYRQLKGGTLAELARTKRNEAAYTDAALMPGACYHVTAFNVVGESPPSNTACLPEFPSAPVNLIFEIRISVP